MTIGVAVIGAGMAGRAHAAAYRIAPTLYKSVLPEIRLVSIGDVNPTFGQLAASRFGYERTDSDWRAIADDPNIDVVSVVVANSLHREIVEGLLDAGKHVLCEKPLSDTLEDAIAMTEAARKAKSLVRIGLTFRRAPAIAAIRDIVRGGELGEVLHFSGKYWADYACDPNGPISWRFKGGPGSGALADIGSHLAYVGEFIAGDISEVSGGQFHTSIKERPVALGAVMGHNKAEVSDKKEAVENDDFASFGAKLGNTRGTFEVSRVAAGHPTTLAFEVFCEKGAARFDQRRSGEFELIYNDGPYGRSGNRQVILGPDHPYLQGGFPIDAPGVGAGQNDGFYFQARAFLEEVAGISETDSLPRVASFDEGLHNMHVLDAVAKSAAMNGAAVSVPAIGKA